MLPTHYHSQPQYAHYAPPSPPQDDNSSRCSLPSISNLLGLADQGSPTSEASFQSQQQQQQHQQQSHPSKPETRPSSSQYGNPPVSRSALPPSPPMTSDTAFEGYNSPSTKSVSQFSVAPSSYHYEESTSPLGYAASESRAHMTPIPRAPVQRPAYQAAQLPPQQNQFVSPAYMSQPAMPSYYPSMQQNPPPPPPPQQQQPQQHHQPQVSGLYYQRPLPQVFPPPVNVSVGVPPAPGANLWQHHHYISPSSAAAFPQSQDRYICPTCSKAFSRPSSLRIHSHSHTGEKPFKCPHAGCGKAFSVRSNMKRHERGCHNIVESSGTGSALVV